MTLFIISLFTFGAIWMFIQTDTAQKLNDPKNRVYAVILTVLLILSGIGWIIGLLMV